MLGEEREERGREGGRKEGRGRRDEGAKKEREKEGEGEREGRKQEGEREGRRERVVCVLSDGLCTSLIPEAQYVYTHVQLHVSLGMRQANMTFKPVETYS